MKKTSTRVLEFISTQIDTLRTVNRIGTAENYQTTHNSFAHYLHHLGHTDLTFSHLTPEIIVGYEVWLHRKGVSRNSSSCYMRILRACYNKYILTVHPPIPLTHHSHRTHRLSHIPSATLFAQVYTGIAQTDKRAIPPHSITLLARLDIRAALIQSGRNPQRKGFDTCIQRLERTRDFFLFSFCSRGLTFVDLAHLRIANIHESTIHYFRKKTQQHITVKIEPQMQAVIHKYKHSNAPTDYLFPILTTTLPTEAHQQYRHALSRYNHDLHTLGNLLAITHPHECRHRSLTSYIARHSWATYAYQSHVPIGIISQAMGHTSMRTTEIYLKSFEQSAVDESNHKLMEKLF